METSNEASKQPMKKPSQFFKKLGDGGKITLQWENINYSVLEKDPKRSTFCNSAYREKRVIQDAQGYAESGNLLAILGPSGSGKTSLLSILAARCPSGNNRMAKLSGNISVNSEPRNEEEFRKLSAYVLQDDDLYAHLTVMETFLLAVNFFLPAVYSQKDRLDLVESIIAELGLGKARDTLIGNDKVRGVSGGERKRTSIGVQLISDPTILFLDEPTSGLDAFQAQSVMQSMKDLAGNNRLVVAVIHQPRSSIFGMFDQLLLLSEGRTMYFGTGQDAVTYFSSVGFACPDTFNPSDYFLDILSVDARNTEDEQTSRNRINFLSNAWEENKKKSILTKNGEARLSQPRAEVSGFNGDDAYCQTFQKRLRIFFLLTWRTWTDQTRNSFANGIRMFFTIFFALVVAGIYSDLGDSQESIQNRNGLLYFVIINQGFGAVTGVLNSFPREKQIVNKERANHAYDTLSYFAAKVIVEIPFAIIPAAFYASIIYYATGLNPQRERVAIFYCLLMLTNLAGMSLGLSVSALMPTVDAANALGTPMMIVAILFGGFYVDIDSIPIVANWIPFFSYLRWAFEAMAINEYKGLTFSCAGLSSQQSCLTTGEMVLERLSFQGHGVSYPLFGLGMVILGFLTTALLFLETSKLKFTPMGHWGQQHRQIVMSSTSHVAPEAEKGMERVVDRKQSSESLSRGIELGPVPSLSGLRPDRKLVDTV